MRAADCKILAESPGGVFRQAKPGTMLFPVFAVFFLYFFFEQTVVIAVVIENAHSSELQPGFGIALRIKF